MKTVSFQKLIDAITARAGIDPTLPEHSHKSAMIADMMNDALGDAWTFYPWPDVVLTQERTPTGSPAKTINYIATGATTIGEVLNVYRDDPSDVVRPLEYDFTTTDTTAVVSDDDYTAGSKVWVRFSIPVPALTISPYNNATAYAAGASVYYQNECYKARATTTGNLPTSTTHWDKQEIPEFLADYLKVKTASMLLFAEGQDQRAALQEQRSENALVKAMDDFWLRRGKTHRWTAIVNDY